MRALLPGAGLVAGGGPMMSARDRQARRPDVPDDRFRDNMRLAGFVLQPSRISSALGEWTHADTGTRRFVWWEGEGTNAAFRRLVEELDAGRVWNGTSRR